MLLFVYAAVWVWIDPIANGAMCQRDDCDPRRRRHLFAQHRAGGNRRPNDGGSYDDRRRTYVVFARVGEPHVRLHRADVLHVPCVDDRTGARA